MISFQRPPFEINLAILQANASLHYSDFLLIFPTGGRAASYHAAKRIFLAQPSLNEFSINHVATFWLLLLAIDRETTNS